MKIKRGTSTFSQKIRKVGINPYVDIPEEISHALGQHGYIPVRGTVNGSPFRATLVPIGGGHHRLFVNTAMRRESGVGVGDQVGFVLEVDTEPRGMPVPPELNEALAGNQEARTRFEKLPPSHQREILAYLNSLKRPETVARNVKKVVDGLLAGRL